MNTKHLWHARHFVAALIGIVVPQQLWAANRAVQVILTPYREFLDDLKAGKIAATATGLALAGQRLD